MLNETILNLIKSFLPQKIYYLRLMKNKMEVREIKTGKAIIKDADTPYSNDRLLIADNRVAEKLLKNILFEFATFAIVEPPISIVIQPIDEVINEISPFEKMIYNDLGQSSGASKVVVCTTQEKLSDRDIMLLFNS